MKAVVFDGSSLSLKYENDYAMPKILKDDDVMIRVEYSGVCGTDLHIIQGEFPSSKKRFVLGHEFSGVICDTGRDCIFKKGQTVVVDPNRACNICGFCRKGKYQYCLTCGINSTIGIWSDGGWAEYVVVPQSQVYVLPENMTTEQGALCEPYSCVSHGFDRAAPLVVGEKILILGAGIIGNLWVTALHHQGHKEVTISEINQKRQDVVGKLGTGFRLITPDVLKSDGLLYDTIVDCTGVAKVMETSLGYLQPGGKYVLFGCCHPAHEAKINPFQVYFKELTIIGVKINPFSFPKALSWMHSMGVRYLSYEKLGVKMYKLSEYEQALQDLKTGQVMKAVFKIM